MKRGNVVVIGNSGVGKSTLINAVLGNDVAETGRGSQGTTGKLTIYESEQIPFRIIDTIGFEPTFIKSRMAINAVQKWSKDSAKEGKEDNQINIIWICIEGTSSKLFPKTTKDISRATSMWPSVPVIVVITKSYSIPERKDNIKMVQNIFDKQKRYQKKSYEIIPVVASTYVLNDSAFAAPEGITDLIDATNKLMPEGIKASESDIATFKLNRKRAMAHSLTGIATTAGAIVGAIPIPLADTAILAPIETGLINALAKIYGVNKDEQSKQFFDSILTVGTAGTVAKTALSTLKAIPGINLAASVLNAIVAGSIIAALGEGTIYTLEQIYLGKESISNIEWVNKVMESQVSSKVLESVQLIATKVEDSTDGKSIGHIITDVFASLSATSGKKSD